MKKFANNGQVIKAYIDQSYEFVSNYRNSLWFKGTELYSYDSLLAIIDVPNSVLLIDSAIKNYSNTTAKQTYALLEQSGSFTLYIIPLKTKPNKVLEYYWNRIEMTIAKFNRAYKHKDYYKTCIKQLLDEIESYASYVGIDKRSKAYQFKHQIIQKLFKHQIL